MYRLDVHTPRLNVFPPNLLTKRRWIGEKNCRRTKRDDLKAGLCIRSLRSFYWLVWEGKSSPLDCVPVFREKRISSRSAIFDCQDLRCRCTGRRRTSTKSKSPQSLLTTSDSPFYIHVARTKGKVRCPQITAIISVTSIAEIRVDDQLTTGKSVLRRGETVCTFSADNCPISVG